MMRCVKHIMLLTIRYRHKMSKIYYYFNEHVMNYIIKGKLQLF